MAGIYFDLSKNFFSTPQTRMKKEYGEREPIKIYFFILYPAQFIYVTR